MLEVPAEPTGVDAAAPAASAQALLRLHEEAVTRMRGTAEEKANVRPKTFIATDMMSEARRFFKASGIAFETVYDDGNPALRIEPQGSGKMPELAIRIQKADGAELIFSPYTALDLGFIGMAGVRTQNFQYTPALFMGAAWLVTEKRLLRHYGVLHELRHA